MVASAATALAVSSALPPPMPTTTSASRPFSCSTALQMSVDPALTVSVPKGTTAATGMDALTHAIEAYTCTVHNPVSDGLALRAIRISRWTCRPR